jgi:hypothetical protein
MIHAWFNCFDFYIFLINRKNCIKSNCYQITNKEDFIMVRFSVYKIVLPTVLLCCGILFNNSPLFAAKLLYKQGFESQGWESDFTGQGTWGDHVKRTTHKPHSGSYCLRGNQKEGRKDPITGLYGIGNPLLDWRGKSDDILQQTPNEAYFSFWFRHDSYNSSGEDGKLLYFIDKKHSVRAMYIGHQLANTKNLTVKYSNGAYSNDWAREHWGYSTVTLGNNNIKSSLSDGKWHHFEYYINYQNHFFRIWVDGYLMRPISHPEKDGDGFEITSGKIYYNPSLDIHWVGFQIFYASTGDNRNFNTCSDAAGYCIGWQLDDLELWNGMPDGNIENPPKPPEGLRILE